MKSFRAIRKSYFEIEGHLKNGELHARGRAKAHWAGSRVINHHAYFLMLFAQLEVRVTERCRRLINRRKTAADWKARRLWDAADVDRMAFMQRVALLTEKGAAVYNQIRSYYDLRCQIAHGAIFPAGRWVIPTVATDIEMIAGAL